MHLPIRPSLEGCSRLAVVEEGQMPALALAEDAQRAQLTERGFWMRRDLQQTAHNRTLCEEKRELVDLIRANNEEADR